MRWSAAWFSQLSSTCIPLKEVYFCQFAIKDTCKSVVIFIVIIVIIVIIISTAANVRNYKSTALVYIPV